MKYEFEFSVERLNCDKFKQKQISIMRHVLENSRLMFDMKFNSYAFIEFNEDDEKHKYPKIEETDGFNRLKTNCVIYDLLETETNKRYYDKAFIYQMNGAKGNGYYGFIFYNSLTGEYKQKYYIDRVEDELCKQLNKSLMILKRYH